MSRFGTVKRSKTESPDASAVTYHNKPAEREITDTIIIAGIDPAVKNYAVRIEEHNLENGEVNTLAFNKVNLIPKLTKGKSKKYRSSLEEKFIFENGDGSIVYNNLYTMLKYYVEEFKLCNYITIERQLPENYKSTRIMQATITYLELLGLVVVEVDPKLKGSTFHVPKGIGKDGLKNWSPYIAREILNGRNDKLSLQVMDLFKTKQDDLADVVLQIMAFLVYIKIYEPPPKPSEFEHAAMVQKLFPK